ENVTLAAVLADGREIRGETTISRSETPIEKISLQPEHCQPLDETLEAIAQADVITLGPGSLFTSLIPNLLVPGIVEAIESSRALKVYICNLMTQRGETNHFTASQHVEAIARHTNRQHLFPHIILNCQAISEPMLERYREEGAEPVRNDSEILREKGFIVHEEELAYEGKSLRHDARKLAEAVLQIFDKEIRP
ncbi:MAG TPA: YvcK family protein, partial [Acidobacteriota bacterium]|nr:YvcK family protein [Acidobacteriota bacterium]